MSQNFTDGAVQYGSKVLTIATVTYVADNIKADEPTKILERTDAKDRPSGQVFIPGFEAGDAQLQLADATTPYPQKGQKFTVTLDPAAGEVLYVISEVSKAFQKDGETKVPIKFRKVYNGDITIET